MKKADFGQEFKISLNETVSLGELEATLGGITIGELAESPEGSYPAGNEVSIDLELRKGAERGTLYLELLSAGYESKNEQSWNGFTVKLVDADDRYATLRIEKVK